MKGLTLVAQTVCESLNDSVRNTIVCHKFAVTAFALPLAQ